MPEEKEVQDLIKVANSTPDDILKSFVQPLSATEGLQAYNLEAPSKKLYPVLTPLRNSIARVSGGFAIQANWKVISNINVGNVRAGVSEGRRGGIIEHDTKDYFATFRGFGLEDYVTFEATYAGKNFEDVKALAVEGTLNATMIQEERLIIGGNTSLAMGKTPTPTLIAGTGGQLASATYSVIAVALGVQAYLDAVGANNGAIGQAFNSATSKVPSKISRANADGTTETFGGGSAQKSNSATVAVSASGKITANVAPVAGAVGYAWYVGTVGAEKLVAVTSINSVVITALPDTNAQPASELYDADNSQSSLDFDGLLYQALKPNSGAYIKVMADGVAGKGTPLTSDGAGGIVEFEEAFIQFYNKYRLSPSVIYVSARELISISKIILKNGGSSIIRLTIADPTNPSAITAGVVVGEYLNKVTGEKVALRVHPNMPAGTVFFYTNSLPYRISNVGNICQMLMRQDYYQIEWALKTRRYEYGVYADGVLQHYAPFSMGVITNIGEE